MEEVLKVGTHSIRTYIYLSLICHNSLFHSISYTIFCHCLVHNDSERGRENTSES